jgi:hypothetical protein
VVAHDNLRIFWRNEIFPALMPVGFSFCPSITIFNAFMSPMPDLDPSAFCNTLLMTDRADGYGLRRCLNPITGRRECEKQLVLSRLAPDPVPKLVAIELHFLGLRCSWIGPSARNSA